MKGTIYCVHCISTGKKYIGQTIQKLQYRINEISWIQDIYQYLPYESLILIITFPITKKINFKYIKYII